MATQKQTVNITTVACSKQNTTKKMSAVMQNYCTLTDDTFKEIHTKHTVKTYFCATTEYRKLQ